MAGGDRCGPSVLVEEDVARARWGNTAITIDAARQHVVLEGDAQVCRHHGDRSGDRRAVHHRAPTRATQVGRKPQQHHAQYYVEDRRVDEQGFES